MSQAARRIETAGGGVKVSEHTPHLLTRDELTADVLLALIQQNRDRAFETLVRLYREEIFDLCARISGSRTEAEDLAQESFIRAYEHLNRYRGDAAPRTWLYRIAINRSISFTRRLKRWRMVRSGDDEADFPELGELASNSEEQHIEDRDLALHARNALQTLPDRQKTAVILRVLKEMSYEQVAESMGISLGGAKANVHQGIQKLRKAMSEIT